ncbi:MAG: malonyl-ACP O-methyltransferase BioC [Betaproteobacteria bacterium]
MMPAKHRVRRAFDKAAHTYDDAAAIQRHACERLAVGLPSEPPPQRMLDAGCGTGYGLRLLAKRFPEAQGIGLDLAPAMLAKARLALGIAGDVEHLPLADASIDAYWSSLTAQWCHLDQLLAEARRVLRPNGRLALATLGPETFAELRQAFAASDLYTHTLGFLDVKSVEERARVAGFRSGKVEREPVVTHHADLKQLLGSIKAIGANQVGSGRRTGLMGRAAWARAQAAYEALRQPAGLPLTYELIYLWAEK